MRSTGLFITFEGGDGTGKSTQIRLLAKKLRRAGYATVVTREPGGTSVGEKLRRIVKSENVDPRTELLLFEASRAELVEKVIRPNLKKGAIVLCDRYEESSLVYQGDVRGLGSELVRKANTIATDGLKSDFVVLLDAGRTVAQTRLLKRAQKSKLADRFDSEGAKFHQQVQGAFRRLAKRDRRLHLYRSDESRNEIHLKIVEDLRKRFKLSI